MKPQQRELVIAATIVVVAIVMHVLIGRLLDFGFTFPILASVVATWTLHRPLGYVLVLAVFAELLSTQPPGIVLAATLVPLVVWRFRSRISVDISFGFSALIALTVALQLTILLARDLTLYGQVPLGRGTLVWGALTVLGFSAAVSIMDLLPVPQRSVISLEGYKLENT